MVATPDFLRESTEVPQLTDVLSDVFEQIEVEGVVTGGFAVRGPWTSRGAISRPFKLIGLVAGTARITVDGPGGPEGPLDLSPGDVVLLNHRTHLEVHGGTGESLPEALIPDTSFDSSSLAEADLALDDVLVGGWIRVSPTGSPLLRTALPGLVHIPAASAARSAEIVRQLFYEVSSRRLGSGFALRQNAQLLLLEILRQHIDQAQPEIGWLRLLADKKLAPALRGMHAAPGRPWGLAELASTAGMSRTGFAERFRAAAGEPPLTYLTRWRMLLAQRALHDPDTRIGELATRLGYGTDSAFSNAFKREVGESPQHYRRRLAATNPAT